MNMDQISKLVETFGGQATTIIICWFAYRISLFLSQLGAFVFVVMSFIRLLHRLIRHFSYYVKIQLAAGTENSCLGTIHDIVELIQLGRKEKEKTMESS